MTYDSYSELFWCNAHQRQAANAKACNPKLGGILLPCHVVDLTGIAELTDERSVSRPPSTPDPKGSRAGECKCGSGHQPENSQ